MKEWEFDTAGDLEGWGSYNHMKDVVAADGSMQGQLVDWDPFIKSPQFEIRATPWQLVQIRLKTDCGGGGELFWTNTTDTPYQGFSPGKETQFEIIGDNQWHEYTLHPYWQGEGKIILLRLDLATARGGGKSFAVDTIRIVDLGAREPVKESDWDLRQGAQGFSAAGDGALSIQAEGLGFKANGNDFELLSPVLKLALDERYNVHFALAANNARGASLIWASQSQSGLKRMPFTIRDDGKLHVYNLDMSTQAAWTGEALLVGLALPRGAYGTLGRLAINDEPLGAPDVEVTGLLVDTALPRVGQDIPLLLTMHNHGGTPASDLKLAELVLPAGLRRVDGGDLTLPAAPAGENVSAVVRVRADKPVTGAVRLRVSGTGAPSDPVTCEVAVTPSLGLPKASYVPEPKPVASDYEIGAYYFPGWNSGTKWEPVRRVAPQRKPVLGWYDEGNPECVDWQIKWAVEHGISYFLVDWYWSAGGRSLEQWVKGYERAKYRNYLKWCVMWANHNAPNTHSEADQRAVTKFWIDNYFKTPGYYQIDGMPVVVMWAPGNLRRDMGGTEGARKALALSQQLAREAGLKGIYFVAMCDNNAGAIAELKSEGYAMTSIYHYMGHGGRAANPARFAFDLVAESNLEHWQGLLKTGILPFLPNLSTGWDARPWHGENTVVISGRTVPLFKRICEDARRFADETGSKRLALGPLNEWGEGSYAEPCQEFGFGMYDAVRDTFCRKPAAGWPADLGPADVGLGPYDFATMDMPLRTSWDFTDGPQGWGAAMGVRDFGAADGILSFTTSSTDPAITISLPSLPAARFAKLTIRMKAEGLAKEDGAQLFFSSSTTFTEGASLHFPVNPDGQWHDYVIDLKAQPRWRGKIRGLRFDPLSTSGRRCRSMRSASSSLSATD